ncbi:MAG: hypothetical protein GJ676_07445 [Rhodobacteraceae bacterium]|nr:hypothetical protein [Paracoccaceae bacterium]
MLRVTVLLFGLCAPAATAAAEPVGPEAFDRYTRGKTLYYGFDGQPYGVERYLPGRRVIWSFLDGECQEGEWYPQGDQICFIYENRNDPQCWQFSMGPGGLTARFQDDPLSTELYESHEIGEEMLCKGPDVGV